MQPLGGAERQVGGEFEGAQLGDLFDFGVVEVAVAAHGEGAAFAFGLRTHHEVQGAGEVFDVAELPFGGAPFDGEQPGGGEVPAEQGVHAGADERCGAQHGHGQSGVGSAGQRGQFFDFDEVADEAGVDFAAERQGLVEGNLVVGVGPVDHGAGDEDDSGDPLRGGGSQHSLCGADVVGAALPSRSLQGAVVGGVDEDVHPRKQGGEPRIAHVRDVPGHSWNVSPARVDADNSGDFSGTLPGEQTFYQ